MWNVTDWQKVVFSDESRFVLGTDDNRVRVWRRPDEWGKLFQQDNADVRIQQELLKTSNVIFRRSSMADPLYPDLSPVEHVWYQLKRHMPSCHSVHDLELAVQDLCAHLPQDNIRCLINSVQNRVAACIVKS
ncbi:transposable element Tcb2 transposase [Trichonephila clavipes]|nr:transposable element Tcb2 transposase [Trichonephila clavipes]